METAILIQALSDLMRIQEPGLSVRPVRPADRAFLRTLNAEERSVAYDGLGLPMTLLERLLDGHLQAQAERHAADFPSAEHFVICDIGVAVGRLSLALEYSQFGRCLRIVDIAMRADTRGKGLGRAVVNIIVNSARTLRYGRVTLSVFAANGTTIRFFKRLGFRIQGVADEAQHVTMAFQLP